MRQKVFTGDMTDETNTAATVGQLCELLLIASSALPDWNTSTGTITLTNAQARRLLALAQKGNVR